MEGIHAFRQIYHWISLWGELKTISSVRKTCFHLPSSKPEANSSEANYLLSHTEVKGMSWDGNIHKYQFQVKLESVRVTFTLQNFYKKEVLLFSMCLRFSSYRQWMKSGTGLCWLKDAASRFMQISTLSPAMIRTAALFSSSNVCLCKDAHSSNMKSSSRKQWLQGKIQ